MDELTVRPTRWSMYPKDGASMSEHSMVFEIEDEGAGEFMVIKQPFGRADISAGEISIDPSEWEEFKNLGDEVMKQIKYHNQ